jgi:branched-chain amino acid transport system substrate-binding protein
MKDHHNKSSISRRKFITTLGVAAGVSTIIPGIPSFVSKDSKNGRPNKTRNHQLKKNLLKLGVLLPPSHIYPAMSKNFIAGMTFYFEQVDNQAGGREIVLLESPTGFGPNSAVQKSRSLIETDNINLVSGIVDMSVNPELRNLFQNQGLFLIANQVGANLIQSKDQSPFVIHNSLDNWRTNWALGRWAAQNSGKKAFVASSFYESGYDALFAFTLGFESGGGEIIQTMVNNLPTEERDMNPVLDAINRSKPDIVFASYSGAEAVEFVHAYHHFGFDRKIPLLGSGFMVDESLLPEIGSSALGIKSCFPWSSSLNHKENTEFKYNYEKRTDKLPDSFAVLGYETAQLIKVAVDLVDGNLENTSLFRKALVNTIIKSPRGQLAMNENTQQFSSPLYLREVKQNEVGLKNEVIEVLRESHDSDYYAIESDSDMKSGWLNPYLCA